MKIKRRNVHLFKVWAIRTAIFGILCLGYYLYIFTPIFTVTTYDIQGVDTISRTSIDTQLHDLAKKKGLFGIPHDKIFTYSNNGILEVVRQNVPDAATITMRPAGLHTVMIQVTSLIPIMRISDTEAITEGGIIFSPTKDIHMYPTMTIASSTRTTIKINGLTFVQLTTGGENVDAHFFETILSVSTKVSSLIFPVESILVEESGDVSLFNGSSTSKVMFTQRMDPKKVWSTIVSAIDTEPLKSKLDTDKAGLLYLDARYGNKLFYHFNDMSFQNGKGTAIIDNHATTTFATSSPAH